MNKREKSERDSMLIISVAVGFATISLLISLLIKGINYLITI